MYSCLMTYHIGVSSMGETLLQFFKLNCKVYLLKFYLTIPIEFVYVVKQQ